MRAAHQVDPEICRPHEPGGERPSQKQPAKPAGGGRPTPRRRTACCPGSRPTPRMVTCASATGSTGWRGARLLLQPVQAGGEQSHRRNPDDHSGWDGWKPRTRRGGICGSRASTCSTSSPLSWEGCQPHRQQPGALTVAEFELQRTKIVSAITRLNADVVGLMEIENNGCGDNSAIANLVGASQRRPAGRGGSRPLDCLAGWQAHRHRRHHRGPHLPARQGDPERPPASSPLPVQQAEAVDASGKPVTINQGCASRWCSASTPQGDAP